MKIKALLSIVVLAVIIALQSCSEDQADDFSGPTAKALDVKFGSGFGTDILRDISIDANGNMYVSTKTKIYKLDAAGNATVFAGSATANLVDGQGTSAGFKNIGLISTDKNGNIYAYDSVTVRKITNAGLVQSVTIAQGPADMEIPDKPFNKGVLEKDGVLYIATQSVVLKIVNGDMTVFAGEFEQGFRDGKSNEARFQGNRNIVLDNSGENLIVADRGSLRKVSLADGTVTTIAGQSTFGMADGPVATASFQSISDIAIDKQGNYYVSAFNTVRKISADGQVTTIAGPVKSDGGAFSAGGLALDSEGKFLYVTDVKVPAQLIKIDLSKF